MDEFKSQLHILYLYHFFNTHRLLKQYEIVAVEDKMWMVLRGGRPEHIRPGEAERRRRRIEELDGEEIDYAPRFIPDGIEDHRQPHWFNQLRWWWVYGPDVSRKFSARCQSAVPWMFSQYSVVKEFVDLEDPETLEVVTAKKVARDLQAATSIVILLQDQGGVQLADLENNYRGEDLLTVRGGVEVRQTLFAARTHMFSLMGAIFYGLTRSNSPARDLVRVEYAPLLKKWEMSGPRIGCYMDLTQVSRDHFYFLDLLESGCPLYYPLDPQFRPAYSEEARVRINRLHNDSQFKRAVEALRTDPPEIRSDGQPPHYSYYRPTLEERLEDPSYTTVMPRYNRWNELVSHANLLLGDVSATDSEPCVNVALTFDWSSYVIDRAILRVGPWVEVLMMRWAMSARSTNVAFILHQALQRGWKHGVALPSDKVMVLAQHVASWRDAAPRSRPDIVPLVIYLEPSGDAPDSWRSQRARIKSVLSRPNATAFLGLGCIYWRLALYYSSPNLPLVQKYAQGVSVLAAVHELGERPVAGYISDGVSSEEKGILLGWTRAEGSEVVRSWFPSPRLLERGGYNIVEWTQIEEDFFIGRVQQIESQHTQGQPLTEAEWDYELHATRRHCLARASMAYPQDSDVEVLRDRMIAELRGTWNGARLKHINSIIDQEELDWMINYSLPASSRAS